MCLASLVPRLCLSVCVCEREKREIAQRDLLRLVRQTREHVFFFFLPFTVRLSSFPSHSASRLSCRLSNECMCVVLACSVSCGSKESFFSPSLFSIFTVASTEGGESVSLALSLSLCLRCRRHSLGEPYRRMPPPKACLPGFPAFPAADPAAAASSLAGADSQAERSFLCSVALSDSLREYPSLPGLLAPSSPAAAAAASSSPS